MYKIEVDKEKCIGCGECVDVCPVEVCEQEAITVSEVD